MTWKNHLYHRVCDLCGKPFDTYNPAQRFCSSDCASVDAYQQEKMRTLRARYKRDVHVTGKLSEKLALAAKDGLSYGKSRAMRERGAVFA